MKNEEGVLQIVLKRKPIIEVFTSVRGLAAWWVVVFHFRDNIWPSQAGLGYELASVGYLAVDLFFILSGFVIQHNYGCPWYSFSWGSVWSFLVARIARVYPLHFFMNILFLLNPIALRYFSASGVIGERYDPVAFFQSMVLVHAWGFGNALTWNTPSWSISVELVAYLAFPVLSWRMLRSCNVAIALSWSGFGLAAIIAFFYVGRFDSLGEGIDILGVPRCIFAFAAGMGIQRIYLSFAGNGRASLVAHVAITSSILFLLSGWVFGWPNYLFVPPAFSGLVLYLSLSKDMLCKLLQLRIFLFAGELSYATYLCHYFVKDWVNFLMIRGEEHSFLPVMVYLAGTFIFSWLLYRWIEVPGRRAVKELYRLKRG